MADDTNALLQGMRGVPTLSSGDTVLVNPLAAMSQGIQAAGQVYGIREKQAQQAWGNILQQSTDENGNVDYQKAQRLAAQNPIASMGMMSALKDTSGLRGAQITQSGALDDLVTSLSASAISDPSDANMASIRARAAATGAPASMLAEIDRIAAIPDPAQRKVAAWQHLSGKMGPGYNLAAGGFPTPTPTTVGPNIVPTGISPPTPYSPGGMSVHPGGVGLGLSPEGAAGYQRWLKEGRDYPDPANPTVTKHGTNETFLKDTGVPDQYIYPGGAPATPGTQPGTSPPATGAPPVPPPPGTRLRSAAGTYPPSGSPAAPVPPGATAPSPAAPTPPDAVPPVSAAPPSPAGTGIRGPVPGAVAAGTASGTATGTASAGMASDLIKRADQVPANKANYANMLSDLDRIGNMPPGGEKQVAIETFLQKATGYGFTMNQGQIAAANTFAKLANIAIGQQLAAIGAPSDSRQALFMGSNPNLDLSKLGNQQIIHMLQGNEDAIQAKARAWNDWRKSGKGDDTYGDFQNDFNQHFDPRVFQQQYMPKDGDEIAALRKRMTGPDGKPTEEGKKFIADTQYARSRGWIK